MRDLESARIRYRGATLFLEETRASRMAREYIELLEARVYELEQAQARLERQQRERVYRVRDVSERLWDTDRALRGLYETEAASANTNPDLEDSK